MSHASSQNLLITDVQIVNEGQITAGDVLIRNGRFSAIGPQASAQAGDAAVYEGTGRYLLPGLIDDQVHFREPGLTHKADIRHESRAAVAGGVTSFMEMPNVKPPSISIEALEAKYDIAATDSVANYSFYLGASNDNLSELDRLDPTRVCGVKVFMGSSTGNMLVDDEQILSGIFQKAPCLIATHCEDTPMITANEAAAKERFGDDVPIEQHPIIRDVEACYASSSRAVDLANRFGSRLHILHITTAKECGLFTPGPIAGKRITAEACVHHLWFDDSAYATRGTQVKCNPAIKTAADRDAVRQAVREGRIDVIATDHAPHTWEEKQNSYFKAPAGLPLIQHLLPALGNLVNQGVFSLEEVVDRACHNVARCYDIQDRGFIREGAAGDCVILDLDTPLNVHRADLQSKCGWSPFDGDQFSASVAATFVNGRQVWDGRSICTDLPGERLLFAR